MEPDFNNTHEVKRLNNRSVGKYILGGLAIAGAVAITYFATRNNSASTINSDAKVPAMIYINGNVINSNVGAIDINNSKLYGVDLDAGVGCKPGSSYNNSKATTKTIVNNKKNVTEPNLESVCNGCIERTTGGKDLLRDPVLDANADKTSYNHLDFLNNK